MDLLPELKARIEYNDQTPNIQYVYVTCENNDSRSKLRMFQSLRNRHEQSDSDEEAYMSQVHRH